MATPHGRGLQLSPRPSTGIARLSSLYPSSAEMLLSAQSVSCNVNRQLRAHRDRRAVSIVAAHNRQPEPAPMGRRAALSALGLAPIVIRPGQARAESVVNDEVDRLKKSDYVQSASCGGSWERAAFVSYRRVPHFLVCRSWPTPQSSWRSQPPRRTSGTRRGCRTTTAGTSG